MQFLDSAALAALAARSVEFRWFVYITAKNRSTGDPESVGLWSGLDNITINVVSAATGGVVSRTYYGAGRLLSIENIGNSIEIDTSSTVTVGLSHIDAKVEDALRMYDPTRAPVEIHLGIMTPGTRTIVDTPRPKFFGEVEEARISALPGGDYGSAELVCVSHTRQFTRSNPDTRSHESQRARSSTDTFFKFAGVSGTRSIDFGGKVEPKPFGKNPKTKKRKGS